MRPQPTLPTGDHETIAGEYRLRVTCAVVGLTSHG
jgi:hypothetical protein